MEALLGLGVDGPERACNEIPTEAVVGVVRWAQDQNKKGRSPESGTIVNKLRSGGLTGYGELKSEPAWFRTWKGRETWIEANVPDLDYDYAETAIISLLQDKQDPTPGSVRTRAQGLQHDQRAHDEDCRRSVEAQRKRSLSGRPDRGTGIAQAGRAPRDKSEAAGSNPAPDEARLGRPESEQKAAA